MFTNGYRTPGKFHDDEQLACVYLSHQKQLRVDSSCECFHDSWTLTFTEEMEQGTWSTW